MRVSGDGRRAAVLVWLAAISGCGSPETRPAAQHHHLEIRGLEYEPARLRVSPGDTVTWTNRDIVPHTATAAGGEWDTGSIAAGASATLVVTEDSGEYLCTYHPTMRGRLEIE